MEKIELECAREKLRGDKLVMKMETAEEKKKGVYVLKDGYNRPKLQSNDLRNMWYRFS